MKPLSPLPPTDHEDSCGPVNRCVCFDMPFTKLLRVAQSRGATNIPTLQDHAVFGKRCGLCLPYIQRMLSTGETAFEPMDEV